MIKRLSVVACAFAFFCILRAAGATQTDDDSARLAAQGQQAIAQNRMSDARESFEKLARLEPSVGEIHATLAAIDFKLKDYEEAVAEIGKAQKLKPGLPRLDSLLGLSLSELGRFAEAAPKLEKGFKQSSDSISRRLCGLQLLRAYGNLGRDADGVQTALELNKLYPEDPEVLYHTGRIYGNYAYVTMEKLRTAAPNSIWMLQARGEANESQKNYDAAIDAFNHVLSVDPHRPGIHYRMGRVYLARFAENRDSKFRESAVQEFNAELELDPHNGNASYELAYLAAQLGDREKARQEFEVVLQRFPDFEEALVGLGGVLLEGQDQKNALAPLERATKIRPDDEVAWYRLAQAERAAGNRQAQEKALAEFRKLHSSTPVGLRKPDQAQEITPQELGNTDQQ
jgi:tetratricopeptide (TPR) repeat protein